MKKALLLLSVLMSSLQAMEQKKAPKVSTWDKTFLDDIRIGVQEAQIEPRLEENEACLTRRKKKVLAPLSPRQKQKVLKLFVAQQVLANESALNVEICGLLEDVLPSSRGVSPRTPTPAPFGRTLSSPYTSKKVICPYCNTSIKSGSLNSHIRKRHDVPARYLHPKDVKRSQSNLG